MSDANDQEHRESVEDLYEAAVEGGVLPAAYEADSHGRVYERTGTEVLPTGMVVHAWANRNDITQEEFDRQREFQRNVRRV